MAAAILALGVITAGCETTNDMETAGTLGGAVTGGVIGGLIDDGGATGIIVGAALGGLIGNRIGAYLDERERRAMARASVEAAESAPTGEKVAWAVPGEQDEVTASGWAVPTSDPYEENDRTCRDLQQAAQKDGEERQQEVTLCRTAEDPSGWHIPAS
ncbi:MAG: glycine zipper 2TM domain-containing protein [Gammaproteobacteria bacterium]|nr:glycine zipper 2TM domain-containing protein [Gammaproteobacteria bacterium]NIR85616.1 glycine zipper 2TM domain-containing protein [Gammaproteobacteria bacterium]NIR90104.1 glycine zipper 2TM domain-containing protein [Gammaproteobacteria bacterium]NIU06750.1 glycine zipper 2TM domain-containing protein [Gammaproteobacteria bacterium]NIV53683.1 glycine zipper 2TM domain-containing protein [Gammaproteobacteria bacterium]